MFNNKEIKEIRNELRTTNELLGKIEEHLRSLTLPPDLVKWSQLLKTFK